MRADSVPGQCIEAGTNSKILHGHIPADKHTRLNISTALPTPSSFSLPQTHATRTPQGNKTRLFKWQRAGVVPDQEKKTNTKQLLF